MPCPEMNKAQFVMKGRDMEPEVFLCENRLDKLEGKQVFGSIAHELIHAFDYCRSEFDEENIEHLACTEVCLQNYI